MENLVENCVLFLYKDSFILERKRFFPLILVAAAVDLR